jgi:hypothetical protein
VARKWWWSTFAISSITQNEEGILSHVDPSPSRIPRPTIHRAPQFETRVKSRTHAQHIRRHAKRFNLPAITLANRGIDSSRVFWGRRSAECLCYYAEGPLRLWVGSGCHRRTLCRQCGWWQIYRTESTDETRRSRRRSNRPAPCPSGTKVAGGL